MEEKGKIKRILENISTQVPKRSRVLTRVAKSDWCASLIVVSVMSNPGFCLTAFAYPSGPRDFKISRQPGGALVEPSGFVWPSIDGETCAGFTFTWRRFEKARLVKKVEKIVEKSKNFQQKIKNLSKKSKNFSKKSKILLKKL